MRSKIILCLVIAILLFGSNIVTSLKLNIEKKSNTEKIEIFTRPAQDHLDFNYCNLSTGKSLGTGTIFEPPYSDCYSWGKALEWLDDFSHACNIFSGAIGACAEAFIGGATAEAMQKIHFYVGRTKNVYVNANIIRSGGTSTIGISAFAGTEKTWSWDDFSINYHRKDVDPWWNWDDIILKIIDLISIILGYEPVNINEAIYCLEDVIDFVELNENMTSLMENEDAEIIPISFSFSADPGFHTIWVGLRATASAFIAGFASAFTMGQVTNITIDGIAAPEPPTVIGPTSGKINKNLDFCAQSHDPNSDKIRYIFDWGDGTDSGWTEYLPSGSTFYKSHVYHREGQYSMKVIVEDTDKMKSSSVKDIKISSSRIFSLNRTLSSFPMLRFFKKEKNNTRS